LVEKRSRFAKKKDNDSVTVAISTFWFVELTTGKMFRLGILA